MKLRNHFIVLLLAAAFVVAGSTAAYADGIPSGYEAGDEQANSSSQNTSASSGNDATGVALTEGNAEGAAAASDAPENAETTSAEGTEQSAQTAEADAENAGNEAAKGTDAANSTETKADAASQINPTTVAVGGIAVVGGAGVLTVIANHLLDWKRNKFMQ